MTGGYASGVTGRTPGKAEALCPMFLLLFLSFLTGGVVRVNSTVQMQRQRGNSGPRYCLGKEFCSGGS